LLGRRELSGPGRRGRAGQGQQHGRDRQVFHRHLPQNLIPSPALLSKIAAMKKMITAILLATTIAGCGEEPQPPARTSAPEPKPAAKAEKKAPPAPKVDVKPQPPPPPPPPPPEDKPKPPSAAVPKVLLDPTLPEWTVTAPATYKAKFSTSKGDFVIQVTREWAPQGADRFYALVKNGFYDDVRFFRVISNFMAQFGMNGEPQVTAAWKNAKIPDDPVTQSN